MLPKNNEKEDRFCITFSSTTNDSLQRASILFVKINFPFFVVPSFLKNILNPQVRINQLVKKHSQQSIFQKNRTCVLYRKGHILVHLEQFEDKTSFFWSVKMSKKIKKRELCASNSFNHHPRLIEKIHSLKFLQIHQSFISPEYLKNLLSTL